jgi:hypothetical protein
MNDDIQITDSPAPSETSSAPVSNTASESAAPSAPMSDEQLTSSLSDAYDRAEAREPSSQPADRVRADNPRTDSPPIPQSLGGRINPDTWAALPREAQELVLQRESESHQKITQLGQEISHMRQSGGMVGELAEVVAHFEPRLPPHVAQMPRVQQIAALYAASEMLDRDPVGSIQKLAAQYGIDLGQIGGNANGGQQTQLVGQYQQAMQQMQAERQQWHAKRLQYIEREAENYIRDKEYWPEIEDEVLRQISAVKESNPGLVEADPLAVMKEAEKRALAITGVATKQSATEAKKRADEAKRHASLNVKSSAGKSPSNVSSDMWSSDNWGAAYDKASRR